MTPDRLTLRRLAMSAMLLALPLDPALAQDSAAVAERLKAAMVQQGIEVSWSNVSGDASSMVLENVTIIPLGGSDALEIGDVTLIGIAEADGGYRVERLETAPFSSVEDGVTLDVDAVVISGMTIPGADAADPLAGIMLYETAELASVAVKFGDRTAFAMQGLAFEMAPPAAAGEMQFTGAADSFEADLGVLEDPQSRAMIDALGYQTIRGNMELAGLWNPKDGRLALSQYDISVEDAGTLGMTFDLGGYTLDYMKEMQALQQSMAETPEDGDSSQQGLAMLDLMQEIVVNGASIRFDDDSLTGRVLELFAAQQGVSAADVANQTKAILPFVLSQIGNPELASQISTAVGTFLDEPRSIEIAAEPPAPVPFAELMDGAMTNPMDLTKKLGVRVTANRQ
jgi:hypothetical protein